MAAYTLIFVSAARLLAFMLLKNGIHFVSNDNICIKKQIKHNLGYRRKLDTEVLYDRLYDRLDIRGTYEHSGGF